MKITVSFSLREYTDRACQRNRAVKYPRFKVEETIPDLPLQSELNAGIDRARAKADREGRRLSKKLGIDCYFILHDYTDPAKKRCAHCNKTYKSSWERGGTCSKKCGEALMRKIFEEAFGN